MASLPYMHWHPADYMADTSHLTTLEHGAYCLILWNYWMTGKPPREDRLWVIAKFPSAEAWTPVEQVLREFFTVADGVWVHTRVEDDMQAALQTVNKKSKAGKQSALARKAQKAVAAKQKSSSSATPVATAEGTGVATAEGTAGQQPSNNKIKENKTKLDKTRETRYRRFAMSSAWRPNAQTVEVIHSLGLVEDFWDGILLQEFALYWKDRGDVRTSAAWEATFLSWVKTKARDAGFDIPEET